jgi:transcriptional regulator with XRE-family HTH domain
MRNETLGQILRSARRSAGFSLRDVERATKGGLSNGHLSLLESDEVKNPSPHHLFLLSVVLKVDYARLLKLAGYMLPGEATNVSPEAAAMLRRTVDFSESERKELEDYAEYIRSKRRTNQ